MHLLHPDESWSIWYFHHYQRSTNTQSPQRDHSAWPRHHDRGSVPKRERVPHLHPLVPLKPEKEGWAFPEGCARKAEESSNKLQALAVL